MMDDIVLHNVTEDGRVMHSFYRRDGQGDWVCRMEGCTETRPFSGRRRDAAKEEDCDAPPLAVHSYAPPSGPGGLHPGQRPVLDVRQLRDG